MSLWAAWIATGETHILILFFALGRVMASWPICALLSLLSMLAGGTSAVKCLDRAANSASDATCDSSRYCFAMLTINGSKCSE